MDGTSLGRDASVDGNARFFPNVESFPEQFCVREDLLSSRGIRA